ncbi:MAG TPA: hypothetical protein VE987_05035, partial [Polyangiaceae bacterium]|nr:hypothetical protein [Polyangiaceae bacterium]
GSRALWETGPAWQPLREVIERLLVTWDFGEAFAALCLCLKPILDPLVAAGFGAEAHARGDYLLAEILASLDEDARWHHDWARALVGTAIALRPENRAGLADAVARWSGPCARAAVALGGLLVEIGPAGPALADGYAAFLEPLGLGLPWIEALEVLRSWR